MTRNRLDVRCGARSLLPLMGIAMLLLTVVVPRSATAQQGDNFEGAVWNFTMTPKAKGLNTLRGRFRVSDRVIYQKEKPEDKEFSKQVGTNHPARRRTRIELTDLRAFAGDKTPPRTGIKGTARLTRDKIGVWSGLFTDGEGRNWDFKCTRVKE